MKQSNSIIMVETIHTVGPAIKVSVTIEADETELDEVRELTAGLDADSEVAVAEEEATEESELTEDQRYVIAALQNSPRSALRVVHRVATELDDSPFDDFVEGSDENSWNDERQYIRDILWSMKSDGLVDNDGQLWYAVEDAPTDVLD